MADAAPEALPLSDEGRQLQLLVQSVSDYAIYMLDPQGYIRSWNSGGRRVKGYEAVEVIGSHFSRFYTPEDIARGEPARSLANARRDGRHAAEGWRVRKDGSRFWASVVIESIWQDGQLYGFAKVTRDITERLEAQRLLQQAQRAMLQSQKLEAVGKLTLGLAHDFNNLLTVMVNALDLLAARHGQDPTTAGLLATAERAADRGALLTRQLLAFARGQELVAEPHAIAAIVQRSLDVFRRCCGDHVHLQLAIGPDLPLVLVDEAQLEAALMNLIVNARDAMPEGGRIELAASAQYRLPPDAPHGPRRNYVAVSVRDDGQGMPAEVIERASEPFFTTKEIGKGSGLGLSQVFGFASQSGGFADIQSRVGQGTTVTVWLPVAEESVHG